MADRIKIGVTDWPISAFDTAVAVAIGDDWTNSAHGFMPALGCIQSLICNTNRCTTGAGTQGAGPERTLVVPHKTERV